MPMREFHATRVDAAPEVLKGSFHPLSAPVDREEACVDDTLLELLEKLAKFGEDNDAQETERPKRMLNITRDTGRLLWIIVRATGATRILEVGTSNAFSTIWLADAARSTGGRVTTLELNPEKIALARANLAAAGLDVVVEIIEGHAALQRTGGSRCSPSGRWRSADVRKIYEAMTIHRFGILQLAVFVLGFGAAASQAQLAPFRDSTQERWGYKRPDGSVAITPYYIGAGQFHEGRAPVEDDDGFAIIDELGTVVERIAVDAVVAAAEPVPPPSDTCAWSGAERFPSTGLECYVRQLRGSGPVVGGEIARRPTSGESFSSA